MVATQNRSTGPSADRPVGGAPPNRSVRPRRGLPGGRAVVGGLLVAVAAVGIFAAVSDAGKGPSTRYVVASKTLEPGTILSEADLATATMDLPAAVAGRSFRDARQLVGTVILSPLDDGELVQASAVGDGQGDAVPSLTVGLESADAYGANLRPGDRVDVYVTYGNDVQSSTRLVTGDAQVIRTNTGDDAIGQSGQVQLTLVVPQDVERMKLLNAVHTGSVSVVRITGAGAGEGGSTETYAPVELNDETKAPSEAAPKGGG